MARKKENRAMCLARTKILKGFGSSSVPNIFTCHHMYRHCKVLAMAVTSHTAAPDTREAHATPEIGTVTKGGFSHTTISCLNIKERREAKIPHILQVG